MPEGHTIHRICRDHRKRYVGKRLAVSSPQGRFRAGARALNGRILERIEAYGKHLFYWWDGAQVLHIHLGLYGRFRHHRSPPPDPRGAVRLRVSDEQHVFDLNGPNACDLMTPPDRDAIAAKLGQDPLRKDADPDIVWQRIHRSRAAIGSLLLNQSILAGVGNIYRAEVLHLLGIHPERIGQSLDRSEFDQLWETLQRLLKIGVRYNRIITAEPNASEMPLGRLRRHEQLLVYKRENCRKCGQAIENWELGNRTIYACLHCQT